MDITVKEKKKFVIENITAMLTDLIISDYPYSFNTGKLSSKILSIY